jgi:hypothetical protein
MKNLLRSEWRKVITTKLWWGLMAAAAAIAALAVVSQIASTSSGGPPGTVSPDPFIQASNQQSLAAAAAAGGVFALAFGIIMMTTEFRHLTSRPTFLIQPRRGRVIGAKLIVAAAIGAVYGLASVVVVVAVMSPWLGTKGVSIGWVSNGLVVTLTRAVIAMAIYAVVGVGVGVLVRNQLAAVIGALAFLYVVEDLFAVIPFLKGCFRFLPGPAGGALVGSTSPGIGGPALTPVQGGLVFLGWGLALALAGWAFTMRRDIP